MGSDAVAPGAFAGSADAIPPGPAKAIAIAAAQVASRPASCPTNCPIIGPTERFMLVDSRRGFPHSTATLLFQLLKY